MTEERALREIIKDAWCAGDLNPTDKFGDFLNRSAKRIKEAGYRLPGGKAPLLTDEEFFGVK